MRHASVTRFSDTYLAIRRLSRDCIGAVAYLTGNFGNGWIVLSPGRPIRRVSGHVEKRGEKSREVFCGLGQPER